MRVEAPRFKHTVREEKVVIKLNTPSGLVEVYFVPDSGKVITRMKIDTLTKVRHPGVILGKDSDGRLWVAHNHYKKKRPVIDSYSDYADGEDVSFDERAVLHSREDVVERAIDEVFAGRSYDFVNYNCQTFINIIVQGKNKSESVDKLSNGTMIAGGIITLLGLLAGNKTAIAAGATIFTVGAGVKIYSRTDW